MPPIATSRRRRTHTALGLSTARHLTSVVMLCLLGAALAAAGADAGTDDAGTDAAQLDGEAVFLAHNCQTCHAVASAEIEAKVKSPKMLGPDLSGHEVEDFAALASYLRKETKLDGTAHLREWKGSDEELQAICRWLESLEPIADAESR